MILGPIATNGRSKTNPVNKGFLGRKFTFDYFIINISLNQNGRHDS